MKVVDLFSGCGGFSLGAHAAGIAPCLAFDNDPILTSSFSHNHPGTELVLSDISLLSGSTIQTKIGGHVDGVLGGPPCQGFSDIGQRRAADPRRELLGHFFRIVKELRPSFFVMENVRGLGYKDSRHILDQALDLLPGFYHILGPLILDAADFGAATRRSRLFIIGYDPSRIDQLTVDDINAAKCRPATVEAAIADLASAKHLGEHDGYDLWKIAKLGRPHQYAGSLRAPGGVFSGHRRTLHSPEVVERFRQVVPGETDPIGRHPRLKWDGQCPTLRAGTGSDRGSFQSVRPIHPDEPRVITVREGARLQGFPDAFRFHQTVWHSFRMIGNSVSPIAAKQILSLLARRATILETSRTAAE